MTRRLGIAASAALVTLAATFVWAQPGGGGDVPGASGDRPAGPMRGRGLAVSAAQAFGLLALDPDIAVTDEQLLKLRNGLRETYLEQQDLMEAMRSGDTDFQAVREIMSGMRERLQTRLAEVLSDEQLDAYHQALQTMRPPRGLGGWRR